MASGGILSGVAPPSYHYLFIIIFQMDIQQNTVRRPYTFDRVVRISFTVILVIAILYLLEILKGVLLPFLVACLVAYMLEPVVRWNMKIIRTQSRFLPVVLTLLEAALVLTLFFVTFTPYLVSETSEMTDMLKHYTSTKTKIPYISDNIHAFIRDNIDINSISMLLSKEEWKEVIKTTVSSSWTFLSSGLAFILGLLSWLIVVLYTIFIMLDYERIMLGFKQLVPVAHRKWAYRTGNDIKDAMTRYFRGQFLIASIVGILFSIGFLIIGLPMGVILGLFIGMLNMVPYLQLISLPITAILCIVCTASTGVNFWVIFWESMAVYIIVQCIQDLILTPKIMGKAMGMNPAIILLSLSIWGTLLGFMGLIIALPMTSLLLSYYNTYIVQRYDRHN